MGLGKKLKKAVGKAVNKATGGNHVLNNVLGTALAIPTGGASLEAKKSANNAIRAKAEKAEAFALAEENRKIAAQESEYRAGVDRQKNFNDELAEQSKTDYAGMGGLIGDDLGGELVGYKKKKYGLIGA